MTLAKILFALVFVLFIIGLTTATGMNPLDVIATF